LPTCLNARCPKCNGDGRIGGKPPETDDEFYERLSGIIRDDSFDSLNPKNDTPWFCRLNVEITQQDIDRFKHEFLDPFLENTCDDYEFWGECYTRGYDPFAKEGRLPKVRYHYRKPFGTYDPLDETGGTELDEYIASGNAVGLTQATTLFTELT
jgi:hypothetical protein